MSNTYESQEMLNRYMLMHWGTPQEIGAFVPDVALGAPAVVHLPVKCAELVAEYAYGYERALDIGCAVGRSSFEMARIFQQVDAFDYSQEFVAAAQELQRTGKREYWRKDSGSSTTQLVANVEAAIDRARVTFSHGNACTLPDTMQGYDAVLMANVLCRLPEPAACLRRMGGEAALVRPGGVLVMTTPFSWLEEYTPRHHWLEHEGDVQRHLSQFELIHQEELPFMIREHRRKFEYIITRASVWRRQP